MPGRGIETLLKLIQINENVAVVVLGYSEISYLEQLTFGRRAAYI